MQTFDVLGFYLDFTTVEGYFPQNFHHIVNADIGVYPYSRFVEGCGPGDPGFIGDGEYGGSTGLLDLHHFTHQTNISSLNFRGEFFDSGAGYLFFDLHQFVRSLDGSRGQVHLSPAGFDLDDLDE